MAPLRAPDRRRLLLALGALAVLAAAPRRARAADAAASGAEVSEAERLLFQLPHLSNVTPPRTLRYRYLREGGADGRLEDRVVLQLTAGSDGACCSVHGDYLSGAERLTLPDITDARANPVLLYFLEHQVRQLHRRTRGTQSHFRNMTRRALANAAPPQAGSVRWGGQDVRAQTVRVSPYLDDPYRNRFAAEANTEYSFVVSQAVPGMLYEMRAAIPGTPPGRSEVLTLEDTESPPAARR